MSRKDELARAWLVKAEHDLQTAHLLMREEQRLLDIAVYHCQQAGEKALKACLTAHDLIFPKTHELGELLNLCLPLSPQFEQFRSHAELLSPLVHRFRYPGDVIEPTRDEADHALHAAEELYQFCAGALERKES